MNKIFIFLFILLPITCFAQQSISVRILNQTDNKPIANASVFLSNASVGGTSNEDGSVILKNARPGKYDLIVSIIGFETYHKNISINNSNINLSDILLIPKIKAIKEVTVKFKSDPNREKYYQWFIDEFLGTSEIARFCKIKNPEMVDLIYDDTNGILTATSADFLEIENEELGYEVKYLLTGFRLDNKYPDTKKVSFEGSAMFREMNGTPAQKRRWQKRRQEVYEGSEMHFLRSALNDHIDKEGFRALRFARVPNPQRPPDSLIQAKIRQFKKIKTEGSNAGDSLLYWNKKSKLPKSFQKMMPTSLMKGDLIRSASQGLFALGYKNTDSLYITYNKSRHFHLTTQPSHLFDPYNKENTLIIFSSPFIMFDRNGGVANPNDITFSGVWGRSRVAELLPLDYEPELNNDNVIDDSPDSRLTDFLVRQMREKVYLHFDKSYYAAGDTIHFKAYVTSDIENKLSDISGVLHVDLINSNDKIDRSIILQLDSGVAWGDFVLSDSLATSDYRVRAYTKWMLNGEGENKYFQRTISVTAIREVKVPESATPSPPSFKAKPDIQFMPEGGGMVDGLLSKISFKAVGINGLGIKVRGAILDDSNKEVSTFTSIHLGMGNFYLKPEEGKSYKARLTYANGIEDIVDLPKADSKGITLSVNNDSVSKATVTIEANAVYYKENKGKNYNVLIYSGGEINTVECKLDSQITKLIILKRRLHTGITTVTLFSSDNIPLCERLFFVQNFNQLNIDLSANKIGYRPREKTALRLNVKNRADSAVIGHFSVSVVNESVAPVDVRSEKTILTEFLLTSDLKGFIEQPNYYFTDITDKKLQELDLVMLTHGYRVFNWKQVLENSNQDITYQPEKGLEITGTVKNMFNSPISKGTVTLIPAAGGSLLSAQSDNKGVFHFSNLSFTDTTHFVLSAVNAKGRNSTKLTYLADKPEPVTIQQLSFQPVTDTVVSAYIDNAKRERNELVNYGHIKGRMIREVKIRGIKVDDKYETQSLAGAGHADQVMHREEIEKISGQLSTSLNGRLHGIVFFKGAPYFFGDAMMVIVDGIEMQGDISAGGAVQPFSVNLLNSTDVETVEVLKYASASIYGMRGGNGVLIITTRKGSRTEAKDIASIGILPITVQGFYKAREFYSPKYDVTNLNNKQRDFRSTIYWKPELVTNQEGNASFDYYNADGTGTYRVVIEGIDEKGNIGRQVYRYKVE